ncbi:MAG: histidine phosphatase family protein [Candidatus Nanoarchaeia archaeon]
MTILILIRHGESAESGNETFLSNKGKEQAELLAKKLSTIPITKIYSSDYPRTVQTLNPYKKLKPEIPTITTEKLREIYRTIIGGPERPGTNPTRAEEDRKRADEILHEITATAKDDDIIAIFAHGNIIRYFIAKAADLTGGNLWDKMTINDASITILELKNNHLHIKTINNIDHLNKDEVLNFYSKKSASIIYN